MQERWQVRAALGPEGAHEANGQGRGAGASGGVRLRQPHPGIICRQLPFFRFFIYFVFSFFRAAKVSYVFSIVLGVVQYLKPARTRPRTSRDV